MEKKFYTDDFEQLLKEKSDQFRMYPSKRVWHSIYNDLHPGRKWPSVAMSMLLIIALLLIGYLNTGDTTISRQFIINSNEQAAITAIARNDHKHIKIKTRPSTSADLQLTGTGSENTSSEDFVREVEITSNLYNFFTQNSAPSLPGMTNDARPEKNPAGNEAGTSNIPGNTNNHNGTGILDKIDTYIKTNQIFNDVVAANKKKRSKASTMTATPAGQPARKDMGIEEEGSTDDIQADNNKNATTIAINDQPAVASLNSPEKNDSKATAAATDEKTDEKNKPSTAKTSLTPEEKAWIENYALHNKQPRKRWKGRLAVGIYATPTMNYRTVSMESRGSLTPFVNTNINSSIDHKPGLGIEAGIGLDYAFTKNVRFKAGAQFNFTNYAISADETNHPVVSLLLMQDAGTGLSYVSTRTATLANPANGSALKPVTIHNTTYQLSIPLGVAFKLASNSKLGWYAGATVQPTYVFSGKAYIVSADMKDYVAEPSAIRSWNLNAGIETYIHYKIGGFTLQVGPQVRYQLFSSYSRKYALVEKPYAMGLKLGLVKGF